MTTLELTAFVAFAPIGSWMIWTGIIAPMIEEMKYQRRRKEALERINS